MLYPAIAPEIEDIQIIGLTLSEDQFAIGACIKSKTDLDITKVKKEIDKRCKDFNLPSVTDVLCVRDYPLNTSKKLIGLQLLSR